MLVMLVVISQQYFYSIDIEHTPEKKCCLNLNFANGKFTKLKSRYRFNFAELKRIL